VLSSRGAMTPHWQYEQHQPVKSSFSAQIMRLLIVGAISLNKDSGRLEQGGKDGG